MTAGIVWFRRDLRLADNPALAAACERHDAVIPVYIHAPEDEGDWPAGTAQRWWLHYSLAEHAEALEALGSTLVIRLGPTREALARLLDETGATAVYWNQLCEPAVAERDRDIAVWLAESRGVAVERSNGGLLFDPASVATGEGRPYRVFTPFWRRLTGAGLPGVATATPARIPPAPDRLASEPLAALNLLATIDEDDGLAAAWTPGEHGAHERLAHFTHAMLPGYANAREHPGIDGTSALSPHLHFGELGPRQVVTTVRACADETAPDAAAFLAEIGWREFAHHLLFHFPHTASEPLNARFEGFPWRDPRGDAAADLEAWQAGRTGIPLVDAAMRQLWRIGWMHNRARMVVASFLTKNLQLHWLEGARWFWDTLVDADLASNTLGWQWSAGCGADAAPWFRIFNPARQGERFDPDGAYVRRWLPALAGLPNRHIHAPWRAPESVLARAGVVLGRDYPRPIVDLRASRAAALAAFERLRA